MASWTLACSACTAYFQMGTAGWRVLVDTANDYFSPNVVLATLAAFMLIGRVRLSPRGTRISRQVAVLSFLIYFVHPVFIDLFLKTGAMGFLHQLPYLPSAGIVLAVALGAFLLGLLVSVLLRKLPYCQALLG